MKVKIAVFLSPSGFNHVCESEIDGYAQVSEWQEVEFAELPRADIVAGQIAALDAMADKVRAEASDRLAYIERQKAELLALPAPDILAEEIAADRREHAAGEAR